MQAELTQVPQMRKELVSAAAKARVHAQRIEWLTSQLPRRLKHPMLQPASLALRSPSSGVTADGSTITEATVDDMGNVSAGSAGTRSPAAAARAPPPSDRARTTQELPEWVAPFAVCFSFATGEEAADEGQPAMETALAAEGARVATERARARVEGARAEVGAAPSESAQAEVEVSSPFRLDEFTDVHAESPFGTRSSAERVDMDDEGEVEAELRATMEEAARAEEAVRVAIEIASHVAAQKLMPKEVEKRMKQVAESICTAFDAQCEFAFHRNYPPTINSPAEAEFARQVMGGIVGAEQVMQQEPTMGAEDCSYMLQAKPGA
jgi:hypothetical protein